MILRGVPCERCGWKYPGFHVCVDLSKPCELEQKLVSRQQIKKTPEAIALKELHNMAVSERNKAIVKNYADGYSFSQLSEIYDTSKGTVMRIVHKAANEGLVTVRARGANNRVMGGI